MHNKSLELSPGVPAITVDAVRMKGGRCAVVGGAAQLYVMSTREVITHKKSWKKVDREEDG
jgi:hypothetical protein